MFHVSRWKPKKVRPGQGQSRGMSSKGVGLGQGRASSSDRLSSTHPLTYEQGPAEMGVFFSGATAELEIPQPSIPATPRAENDSIRNSSGRLSAEGRKKRKEESRRRIHRLRHLTSVTMYGTQFSSSVPNFQSCSGCFHVSVGRPVWLAIKKRPS